LGDALSGPQVHELELHLLAVSSGACCRMSSRWRSAGSVSFFKSSLTCRLCTRPFRTCKPASARNFGLSMRRFAKHRGFAGQWRVPQRGGMNGEMWTAHLGQNPLGLQLRQGWYAAGLPLLAPLAGGHGDTCSTRRSMHTEQREEGKVYAGAVPMLRASRFDSLAIVGEARGDACLPIPDGKAPD